MGLAGLYNIQNKEIFFFFVVGRVVVTAQAQVTGHAAQPYPEPLQGLMPMVCLS